MTALAWPSVTIMIVKPFRIVLLSPECITANYVWSLSKSSHVENGGGHFSIEARSGAPTPITREG